MRTLSLLWFALVLWLLHSNLKGYSEMDCFLSSVRVIAILKEFIISPRNIVCWEGTRTDFSGLIVNCSSHKTATVALIILKQISKVSPRNSESSIYFTDKCPFDLRYLKAGVKRFIKTLRADENPLVRTIYW